MVVAGVEALGVRAARSATPARVSRHRVDDRTAWPGKIVTFRGKLDPRRRTHHTAGLDNWPRPTITPKLNLTPSRKGAVHVCCMLYATDTNLARNGPPAIG